MEQKTYNIIYKGSKLGNFELLKYAKLSSGYIVYLFRGAICPKVFNYIVSVRKGDETVLFHQLMEFNRPFSIYLDCVAFYA